MTKGLKTQILDDVICGAPLCTQLKNWVWGGDVEPIITQYLVKKGGGVRLRLRLNTEDSLPPLSEEGGSQKLPKNLLSYDM